MRNLKKILALVLALVMSLSLMATAGASSFPDVDAENPYATAIEVLDELKVFQGYKEDGTFRPTETLNRAQAAVLVYRIATGDVEDKYLDNYTYMQQSKFTDLDGYNWAKGYINYCQNAGIVVGTSSTTFDPGAKVTGYQLLVMLLRTLGYGKAGEFADPKGWELQTATIAEREGITENVTSGDFGAPAPRQMVAEILFRGLLTETVEYSALVPGGYTKSGETLGMREFGLEKVSGVVMANQWANLNGDDEVILKDGNTELLVTEDDATRTLNLAISTELDAVGMTYNAYIAGMSGTKTALTMEASSDNVVAFNEGKSINTGELDEGFSSMEKLAGTENIKITDDTQYYFNYDKSWYRDCTSEYLIRYRVEVGEEILVGGTGHYTQTSFVTDHANWYTYLTNLINDPEMDGNTVIKSVSVEYTKGAYTGHDTDDGDATDGTPTKKPLAYICTIRPDTQIDQIDLDIMQEIFYSADRLQANPDADKVAGYVDGEVYVGTSSLEDKSDKMSWKEFVKTYIVDDDENYIFTWCNNGESVRIIDNNGDGKAEYALLIEYRLDKAIDTYKDVLQFNRLNLKASDTEEITYVDEIVEGDVIVWTFIDGRVTIWKSETDTDKIQTKSFKNITVTTEGGETYGQSGIYNDTGMDQIILNMNDKTEYIMYKDRFGFVRAYELAGGTQYALLTEMYPTGTQNWNYVKTTGAMVELKAGDAAIEEFPVAGGSDNLFFNDSPWTSRTLYGYVNNNYLQPAIAHLGLVRNQNVGATSGAAYIEWNRNVYAPVADANGFIGVFDYGPVVYGASNAPSGPVALPNTSAGTAPHSFSFSFTNVAIYTTNDDGSVNLSTAAKLAKTQNGEQIYYVTSDIGARVAKTWQTKWMEDNNSTKAAFDAAVSSGALTPVYAVDYVQLAPQDIKAGTRHYAIDADYEVNYDASANGYVDATVNTEYYIVSESGATYKVSYDNIPEIAAEDIRASYAVAKNTSYAEDGRDYWVADVIVIEVNGLVNNYESISLMYYNPWETSNSVRYVSSLNNEWTALQPDYEGQAKMDVVPEGSGSQFTWGNSSWNETNYGFYKLFNTELETEGTLKAGSVEQIEDNWNDHGIYAGTVQRIKGILNSSGYIDVDTQGRSYNGTPISDSWVKHLTVRNVPIYRVEETEANTLELSEIDSYNEVLLGDQLIWVYNVAENKLSYIVDLGSRTKSVHGFNYSAETWLWNTYLDIIDEQINAGLTGLEVYLGVTGTETLAVSDVKSNKGAGSAQGTNPVKLVVPEDATTVQFTVTPSGAVAPEDLIVTPAAGWNLWERKTADNGTDLEVTIIKVSQIQSLDPEVARIVGTNTVMTTSYFTTVVLAEIADLVAEYEAADAAGKEALAKDMAAAKEILAQSKAGTDEDNTEALTAIAEAEQEIAFATGEEDRPVTEEAAAATLVEKYNTWVLAAVEAKPAALYALIQAAIDYKAVAGVPADAGEVKDAYDAAVDEINAAVKEAADDLPDALATSVAATTLGAIKTALDSIEVVNKLPTGCLDLATWSNNTTSTSGTVTQESYTADAAKVEAKKDLVTIATELVETYNAYDTAVDAGATQSLLDTLFAAFKAAKEAVDALPTPDKSIVSTSTLDTLLGGASGDPTPAEAYNAYDDIIADLPVDASNVGLVAKADAPGTYDPATKTMTIAPDTSISDADTVLGWFDATADAVFGNNMNNSGTKVESAALVANSCEAGDTEGEYVFTFPGIKGGKAATLTITVVETTPAQAVAHDLAAAVEAAEEVTTVSKSIAACTEDAVAAEIEAQIKVALGENQGAIEGDYGCTITVESCTLVVDGDWEPVAANGSRTVTVKVVIKAVKGEVNDSEELTWDVRYTNANPS